MKGDGIIIENINYKLVNFLLIILIIFFLSKISNYVLTFVLFLKKILLPIIISVVISYIVNPFVISINKKINNQKISSILIISILFIILGSMIYFIFPFLMKQLINLKTTVIPLCNNIYLKYKMVSIFDFETYIVDKIDNLLDLFLNKSIYIILSSFKVISYIFLIFALSIYFSFNIDKIKSFIYKKINDKNMKYFFKNTDNMLNDYFKGLIYIMIIEGIEYLIVYFIIGHQNYLLLGFCSFFSPIIPYFGGMVTNAIAIITSLKNKSLFIKTCLVCFIAPFIDSYIIDPKIYSKTIKLSSFKVILSIVIISNLFGAIGGVLAIPILIIVNNVINCYNKKKKG